ncbi:MAG: hypothetical protein C9356_20240 [Oleiphilus sp.]|nr:MAG: hypothetical protein C9356_20240 [Oleiphilus sp.]
MAETKYSNYSFLIESLVSVYRKEKGLPKSFYRSKAGIGEALSHFIVQWSETHEAGKDQETIELNERAMKFVHSEMDWSKDGCKLLFIETHELANNLINGQFRIPNPDDLELFADSFILSLPKPMYYLSEDVGSLLVNLNEYTSHPGDTCVEIRFRIGPEQYLSNTFYYWSQINRVLDCKGHQDYVGLNPHGSEGYLSLIEFELIKLVGGLFVYACLNENTIESGFPATRALLRSKIVSKSEVTNLILSNDGVRREHDNKKCHYRTFHFRQLVDDRYYKGKFAEMAKGSRVIPVKAAYIGAKVDPYRVIQEDTK